MQLHQASRQWMSRPDDERFLSLTELHSFCQSNRENSRQLDMEVDKLTAAPVEGDNEHKSLVVMGPNGAPAVPTHWAFGQLAQLADAPPHYLRKLPAELAADNINWGLARSEKTEAKVLLRKNGVVQMNALTSPSYGRIWNSQITEALVRHFGDGITGDFRVPGEFSKRVEVDKGNTTIYASDRDMFVFLADEENRIELPNRRDGKSGSLARGFFCWNSEVGSQTAGIAAFLFDYACCNRIVWGAQGYKEIKLRHTKSAPGRWIDEAKPALIAYKESSELPMLEVLKDAQAHKLGDQDDVRAFLEKRFTKGQAQAIQLAHAAEEGRPIETLWDAVTGTTAYAKGVPHQDARVAIEREAGLMLK